MNDNRLGGTLLVAANAAGIITMVLHPVGGHGLPAPDEIQKLVLLDRVVHGLALASIPMLFLGMMALSRTLTGAGRLPLAALVVYGFAAAAILTAGAMSGFVFADILSRMSPGDPQLEWQRMLLDYTHQINQAFSSMYAVGSCAAIVLWSLAMLKNRRMPAALAIYGLVIGLAIPAALFAGVLTPGVHGFGVIVLAQAVWNVTAGVLLMRAGETIDQPRPGALPA